MKKTIRINENQLKELVEDVLNELDWRTYQSASDKRRQQADASWDALRAYQNSVGNPVDYDKNAKGIYRQHSKADQSSNALMQAAQDSFNKKYGTNSTFYPNYNRDDNGNGTGDTFSVNSYNPRSGIMRTVQNGKATERRWGVPTSDDYYPLVNDIRYHPDAMVANYQKGDAKYNRDRGKWESPGQYWNESVARRVTESIMRKLRRM